MGLRAPSGWSANAPQTKEQPTGLTPKQEDMSGSMYPGAFKPSEPKPAEEKGTVGTAQLGQETGAEKQAAPDKLAQKKQELKDSGIQQAVQQASQKIGSFKYKLQEYVNTFLQEGPSAVGVKTAWNAQTGKYEVIDAANALDPVVAEKQAQQAKIKEAMSPYMQGTNAKDFSQVVKEMNLGGSDAGTARLLQLSDALDRMKKSGLEGSQEAKALEAQINDLDQFGMMGDLRKAKKDYEDVMGGAKYSGDTGKTGYTTIDLASMEADKIRNELENASVSSSGLFSGDFESDLKRAFDKQSQAAKRSEGVSTETDKQVSAAFNLMLKDTRSGMTTARKSLEDAMGGVAGTLKEQLKNTPGFEMWGDMLADKGTFLDTTLKMLNDPNSGIGADQKKQMLKYLGTAGGSDGQMYLWLNELAKGGSFTVDGEKVTPTWEQKDQLYRIMSDQSLDADTKTSAINQVMKNTMVKDPNSPIDATETIDEYLKDALTSTQGGEGGIKKFTDGLTQTIATFMGSKSEQVFTKVMKDRLGKSIVGVENMNLEQLKAAFDALPADQKNSLTKDLKAGLDASLIEASNAITTQAAEGIKKAETTIATKRKEIEQETNRLNTLKQQNANIIPLAYNTFSNSLTNAWKGRDAKFAEEVATIKNLQWVKDMQKNVGTDTTWVNELANSALLDQMRSLLDSAGIVLDSVAGARTSDFLNKSTGEINRAGLQAHAKALEAVILGFLQNRTKGMETFSNAFANSDQGRLILAKQAERTKEIDAASANVAKYANQLTDAEKTIANSKELISSGKALSTVTGSDELINQLVGGVDKDTKLNPTLAGMLQQDNQGGYMLSFGGKFIPVTSKDLLDLNAAMSGNAKQGITDTTTDANYQVPVLSGQDVTPFGGFTGGKAAFPAGVTPAQEKTARENGVMWDPKTQTYWANAAPRGSNGTAADWVQVGSNIVGAIKKGIEWLKMTPAQRSGLAGAQSNFENQVHQDAINETVNQAVRDTQGENGDNFTENIRNLEGKQKSERDLPSGNIA